LEMNDPLTAYVVNDQCSCMLRKLLQGLTDCVVNVNLPTMQSTTLLFSQLDILTAPLSEN
jgi:hypothetical protein